MTLTEITKPYGEPNILAEYIALQLESRHESEWPWLSLNLINKLNRQYITTISLIIFGYFVFQKYFSTLLGSDLLIEEEFAN
jgi:hypothetical protein